MDGYGEIRFYNGKLHTKSTLIDDQLLIVGWQNMRYSALGKGAVPFENTQFGTSPQNRERS